MADDDSGPTDKDFSEYTFEEALKAVTGEGGDLHAITKEKLFTFDPGSQDAGDISYHAWDKYYYSVKINQAALDSWKTVVSTINEMMPDVARGKRGSMNHQSLLDLQTAIKGFATWSGDTADSMNNWATRLDSDDPAFQGKAAFLIQWRLKTNGEGLTDTYQQVTTRPGRPIADVVGEAAAGLHHFNTVMANSWDFIYPDIENWLVKYAYYDLRQVHQYILDKGLQVGTDNYKLKHKSREEGERYVRDRLREYPDGNLASAAAWQKMSDDIQHAALIKLRQILDAPAQAAISALAAKYRLASDALVEITSPDPSTPPQPNLDDPNGDGNITIDLNGPNGDSNVDLNGQDGSDGYVPPPDGSDGDSSTDVPPADGSSDSSVPPPDGSSDGGIPVPDGSSDGVVPVPDGNNGSVPPADGSSDGSVPLPNSGGFGDDGAPPSGDGTGNGAAPSPDSGFGDPNASGDVPPANGGSGGFVPALASTGGGGTGLGSGSTGNGGKSAPSANGAFEENPAGNGVITPPDGDGTGDVPVPSAVGQSKTDLPPGVGQSGVAPPSGGVGDGVGVGAGAGSGAGAGLGGPGGFGSDPGKGFGSGTGLGDANGGVGDGKYAAGLGGGLGGAGGGLGGAGGTGSGGGSGTGGLGGGFGNGGPNGTPIRLSGGSPGMNGAPESSGGPGGIPFFPPMMGGAGAGAAGGQPQERERQTWLSEDEEIWGTRVRGGSGVIGRLDEVEYEAEELPVDAPSRRQRRGDSPRRPHPGEQHEREAAASTEEASGST